MRIRGCSNALLRGVWFNPILDEVFLFGVERKDQLLFERVCALVIQVFVDYCEKSSFQAESV